MLYLNAKCVIYAIGIMKFVSEKRQIFTNAFLSYTHRKLSCNNVDSLIYTVVYFIKLIFCGTFLLICNSFNAEKEFGSKLIHILNSLFYLVFVSPIKSCEATGR